MLCWQFLLFCVIAQRLDAREAGKRAHLAQFLDQHHLLDDMRVAIRYADGRHLKIVGLWSNFGMAQHPPFRLFQLGWPGAGFVLDAAFHLLDPAKKFIIAIGTQAQPFQDLPAP